MPFVYKVPRSKGIEHPVSRRNLMKPTIVELTLELATQIEGLELKIAPDGGETVLPLNPTIPTL
jgi:hypothetical protein